MNNQNLNNIATPQVLERYCYTSAAGGLPEYIINEIIMFLEKNKGKTFNYIEDRFEMPGKDGEVNKCVHVKLNVVAVPQVQTPSLGDYARTLPYNPLEIYYNNSPLRADQVYCSGATPQDDIIYCDKKNVKSGYEYRKGY